MISDRQAWERFEQQIAPSIRLTLPGGDAPAAS
jgi:hypothetical protein